MAAADVEGAPDFAPRETEADKKGDVKSLERKADRTLYLLLKKDRKQHAWQFRASCTLSSGFAIADFALRAAQGGVEGEESLVEAAKRELHEETGVNVDVWPSGRVPAGAFTYAFPAAHKKKHPEHEGAKVRFCALRDRLDFSTTDLFLSACRSSSCLCASCAVRSSRTSKRASSTLRG